VYVRVNYQGHRKTRMFNSTKAAEKYAEHVEALLKLGKVEGVFAAPMSEAPADPGPTFAEVVERWWAVDGQSLKVGTRDTYANILSLYLQPAFGPWPIAEISRADVESWWAGVRAKGLSHQRLTNIRAVAGAIFQRAVASGILQGSPVDAIRGRLGREDREKRQAEWLTEPELAKVLSVAGTREPRFYPGLLTLVSTGIRLGEALGLQVGDVDLEREKLYIRRSVRKLRVGSPKSGKPRTVDVPPVTVAVLRDWIATVQAEAAVRGQEPLWLFPSLTGRLLDSSSVRDALRRVLLGAGITRPFRIHDLRHTYASLAIQREVPLVIVSRQLGHGSVAITDAVYGHLAPEATRAAAMAWEAILTVPGRNLGATQTPEPA
jgi:integrase